MKKMYATLALITLAQFSAPAQPVANASDVAISNFSGEFFFGSAEGLVPGPGGPNQTWDYSFLELFPAGTNATVPLAGSPFATTFPNSNWVYKFSGWGGDSYYYHLVTPSKLEILSLALTANTGENYSQNPRTLAEFPLTYNTSYNDSYRDDNTTEDTQVTATYDAYGTLIMPYKTFTNVIRQKVVTNGVTDYLWFNVSPFYPILQTVLEENAIGVTKSSTVLSVGEQDHSKMFTVYPNPVSDMLSIESAEGKSTDMKVTLTDLTGKVLATASPAPGGHTVQVNMGKYPAGMYFATITSTDTGSSHTRKILRK